MEKANIKGIKNFYKNRKVLVTGHTGFKGAWLSIWLNELGAKVIGYAQAPKNTNDVFNATNLNKKITDLRGDIRDLQKLSFVFKKYKPEIVFHLAAQSLVRESYDSPHYTFEANVMGTVNVLECIRINEVKSGVIITSDKCYKNKEWMHGYREDDELGGSDPYSASKSCAEFVAASYTKSYFANSKINIATVRAGNVIGGGDWCKDRIVPDAVTALLKNEPIPVRNPNSIRPWQYVLEPLYGYLLLGSLLHYDSKYVGSYNFWPNPDSIKSVKEIVEQIIKLWGNGSWSVTKNKAEKKHETKLLLLDNKKSHFLLGWKPHLNIEQSLRLTVDWYKKLDMSEKADLYPICKKQIDDYMKILE